MRREKTSKGEGWREKAGELASWQAEQERRENLYLAQVHLLREAEGEVKSTEETGRTSCDLIALFARVGQG